MTASDDPDLLTLTEAAKRLGVHIQTIRAWTREGRIPSYRMGQRYVRVSWSALIEALTPGTQPSGLGDNSDTGGKA